MDRRLKELLDWLAINQGQGRMHNLPKTMPKGWTPDSARQFPKDDSGIWKGPHK